MTDEPETETVELIGGPVDGGTYEVSVHQNGLAVKLNPSRNHADGIEQQTVAWYARVANDAVMEFDTYTRGPVDDLPTTGPF